MPLNRFFGQQLNIKTLTAQPERPLVPDLPFDPKKEITPERWGDIKRHLEVLKEDNEWAIFFQDAENAALVFPERISELPLEGVFEKAQERLGVYEKDRQWISAIALGVRIKTLFPEKFTTIHFSESVWEGIKRIREFSDEKDIGLSEKDTKLLSPKRFLESKGETKKSLWLKSLKEMEQQGDLVKFALYAVAMKILFPEAFHKTFTLQREMWEKLRDRSEERRVGKECRSRWSPYH